MGRVSWSLSKVDCDLVVSNALVPSTQNATGRLLDDGPLRILPGERAHILHAGEERDGGEHHFLIVLAAAASAPLSMTSHLIILPRSNRIRTPGRSRAIASRADEPQWHNTKETILISAMKAMETAQLMSSAALLTLSTCSMD